jgi:hypothetical protein
LNNAVQFWSQVTTMERRISNDVLSGKLPWQPEPAQGFDPLTEAPLAIVEHVYISAVEGFQTPIRDYSSTAGATRAICLAPLRLAAQRLVEKSHRLATEEEIAQYQKGNLSRKVWRDAQESKNQPVFRVKLPGTEAA